MADLFPLHRRRSAHSVLPGIPQYQHQYQHQEHPPGGQSEEDDSGTMCLQDELVKSRGGRHSTSEVRLSISPAMPISLDRTLTAPTRTLSHGETAMILSGNSSEGCESSSLCTDGILSDGATTTTHSTGVSSAASGDDLSPSPGLSPQTSSSALTPEGGPGQGETLRGRRRRKLRGSQYASFTLPLAKGRGRQQRDSFAQLLGSNRSSNVGSQSSLSGASGGLSVRSGRSPGLEKLSSATSLVSQSSVKSVRFSPAVEIAAD